MALTRNEVIDVLPLFIRRDLSRLSEFIQQTQHLTRLQKIDSLRAVSQLAFTPDDPEAVATVLKTLGI